VQDIVRDNADQRRLIDGADDTVIRAGCEPRRYVGIYLAYRSLAAISRAPKEVS
jgi:hypothetical protein